MSPKWTARTMASTRVSQNSEKTRRYMERTSKASVWLLSKICLTVWVREGEWEEWGGEGEVERRARGRSRGRGRGGGRARARARGRGSRQEKLVRWPLS